MKSVFRITSSVLSVFFAACILSSCATAPQASKTAPEPAAPATSPKKIVVAKINDASLTMHDLVRMMNNLPELAPGSAPETLDERKKRALDSLVLLELAYQRASAQGLNPDSARVQLALENYKEQFDGEQGFQDYLKRHDMTDADIRTNIERSLAINTIYTKEVVESTVVPDEKLLEEFEKDKKQFIQSEKVSVIDVYLIKGKENGKALKKKAKELLAKIKADPNKDPWQLILDGSFMVRNLTVNKERDKELYNAAKKLKPQGLSGVIETPQSIHVIKLKEYSPERQLTFEEAKPKIAEKLKGPYVDKKTKEWEAELKKDAQIDLYPEALGLTQKDGNTTEPAQTDKK